MEKQKIKLEPLRKDEQNQLHGGFDFVSLVSLDVIVSNYNCINSSAANPNGQCSISNVNCSKCSCNSGGDGTPLKPIIVNTSCNSKCLVTE